MKIPLTGRIGRILPKFLPVYFLILVSLGFILWYVFSLHSLSFSPAYSTVIEDRSGELLGASTSKDGQWRFPPPDSLPAKYIACLLAFEDKRFYSHPGIDFRALG